MAVSWHGTLHVIHFSNLVWDNGLYSVNYILNKRWLASSQAGSIGKTTSQRVEVGQWEQEYSGLAVWLQPHKLQDVIALLNMVLSHLANRDKNNISYKN